MSVIHFLLVGAHRGIPNELMWQNSQAVPVDPHLLPEPDVAVQEFESFGGNLTLFSPFSCDPLQGRPDLVTQRETQFHGRYPDFGPFFYTVVNGDYSLFRDGLLYLIDITKQLETYL